MMVDPQELLTGTFEIMFFGVPTYREIVDIDRVVVDQDGHPMCLIEEDGRIFNWRNIVSMKRT